jgi:hypothetical protein
MKNFIYFLIAMTSIILFGCVKPEDKTGTVTYFTNITYQVTGTGSVTNADITYGNEKYSSSQYPDSLIWDYTSLPSYTLPFSYTESTCVDHPVKLSAVAAGKSGATLILTILDNGVAVATATYTSNGFLWGGVLVYNIPKPH